jgi:hypothetical protein
MKTEKFIIVLLKRYGTKSKESKGQNKFSSHKGRTQKEALREKKKKRKIEFPKNKGYVLSKDVPPTKKERRAIEKGRQEGGRESYKDEYALNCHH